MGGDVEQLEFDTSGESLFIPGLTLRALRDSRYRNPAYALSELVDNSIDARARHIDVLCFEREELVTVRRLWKLSEVAVLDDGHGMSGETLVQALRFGGRQFDARRRIGKYGMGLPTASVSQCKRVDVWTWQNGIEDLRHCYIDVDAIEQHDMSDVPMPDQEPIPAYWLDAAFSDTFNQAHGTLVAWSQIDRINQRAETVFSHIEREIGRIHRHFINDGEVVIRAASFREGAQGIHIETERRIRPNDPQYLMQRTSTPDPWDNAAMFEEHSRKTFTATVNGQEESIDVVYSIVKPEALKVPGGIPGNAPHGKHAVRNMGVSVVRERRQILLEDAFVRAGGASTIPENRWWGCEVSFNGGADDLFGVDHNKQMAANFTDAARTLMNSDDNDRILLDEMADGEDIIYQVVVHIRRTTRNMLNTIRTLMERRREGQTGDRCGSPPKQKRWQNRRLKRRLRRRKSRGQLQTSSVRSCRRDSEKNCSNAPLSPKGERRTTLASWQNTWLRTTLGITSNPTVSTDSRCSAFGMTEAYSESSLTWTTRFTTSFACSRTRRSLT